MICTWMPRAEKELLAVAEYVANEFGTSHALALVAKIEQWDAWLAENPEIARVEPTLIHKKKHVYRSRHARWALKHRGSQ